MVDTLLLEIEKEGLEIPENEYGYGLWEPNKWHPKNLIGIRYFVTKETTVDRDGSVEKGDIKDVTEKDKKIYQKSLETLAKSQHSLYSHILLKIRSGRAADKIVRGLAQKVGIRTEEGLYQLDRVLKSFADLETLSNYNPLIDKHRKNGILYLKDEEGLIDPSITVEQVKQVADILRKCTSFEFVKKYDEVAEFYETRPASIAYVGGLEQKITGVSARENVSGTVESVGKSYKVPVRVDLSARSVDKFYPKQEDKTIRPEKPTKKRWFGRLIEYTTSKAAALFSV
ncbi:hypothetical protein HYV88_02840 [Candidatus Woesearchaeota archaeon]|nr:hypothetical protein [Candidatus Woesearchaeota archaeon]